MVDRITKLKSLLPDEKCAVLITSDENRVYFSSFRSSAGAVLVTKNSATLFVDFRYYLAAKAQACIDVVCYNKLYESINDVLKRESIDSIIIEEQSVTVSRLEMLQNNLSVQIVTDFKLSEKILNMRATKSQYEIDCIKKAQSISEKSFVELLNMIKAGVSEMSLALELEYMMKKHGAQRSAFDIIAVSGANSALPHGVPTDKTICEGDFITFDFGAVVDGYHSDMTRTVALGFATDKMIEVYNTVFEAHRLAAQTVKEGVTNACVDLAARKFIESKGYGEFFGHSTGHGVGLEIHEKPTVYKTNNDTLNRGMVITIEPGVYIPNEFGVRIEDMYLVTKSGNEDLATLDKELIIL